MLFWWHKKNCKFPTIVSLTWHILGILASQIETKHIFSIARFFKTLQKCCLKQKIWKLIFINKNWPFDLWIGCVKSIDLASACEMESDLIVELEVEFHDDKIDHNDFFDLKKVFQIFFHCASG